MRPTTSSLHAPPKLSNIHILLADGDLYMSSILCHMLHTMGFTNVTRSSNGQKALELIETRQIDILITEWSMEGMDGIDLAQYMRDPKKSPHLTLPIIMMTGRAERQNVEQARDFGITEFVVKPVTTVMLFDRIRRIFDSPRDFVIASTYVGPDRRHKQSDREGAEQRVTKPFIASKASVALNSNEDPVIVSKNFDLRRKANLVDSLSTVITPQLLSKADEVIKSYRSESNQWISDDMQALERAIGMLAGDLPGASQHAQNAALSIKSRAGMFGYDMASNVAFALYVFLYHDFKPANAAHLLILRKHVEVMKVLLAGQQLGNTKEMEEELTSELLKMTAKLKDIRSIPEELQNAAN